MTNFRLKKVYFLFSAFAAFIVHLPFAFSETSGFSLKKAAGVSVQNSNNASSSLLYKMYDSLKLNMSGLSEHAFNYAVKGYEYLKCQGRLANENILSIVDFTKPSSQKRLFVIDLKNYRVLFNTYCAHGQGSGEAIAKGFSNIPESYQSSLGFYTTDDTYNGKNGYSMHLNGLEKGFNDKAEERSIVMHGAPYVSENFIQSRGYLGRSWGCPAVPEQLNKPIIDKIKNGSCLFIFSENKTYLSKSRIINA